MYVRLWRVRVGGEEAEARLVDCMDNNPTSIW
jgi:hypothetical protein